MAFGARGWASARLMRLQGGDLSVSDREDGRRGARFVARLPIVRPPPDGAPPGARRSGGGGGRDAARPAAPPSPVALEGKVVLVADDSEANRCGACAQRFDARAK